MEPAVDCISKGKARIRYEFGCKVSLTTTHKQGLVIASQSIAGNPYDGHTLKSALKQSEELTNIKIKSACVDKGYKGHSIDQEASGINIFISGQKKHNSSTSAKVSPDQSRNNSNADQQLSQ